MVIKPNAETFLELCSKGLCIPVELELLSDIETPLSVYWKLAHDEQYSFLLESVTGGEQLARYSIIGVRPQIVLRTKDSQFSIERDGVIEQGELGPGTDPLDVLDSHLRPLKCVEHEGLPKFFGGAVGLLGYDIVRFFEKLPNTLKDDLQIDDLAMMITQAVVIFDHAMNKIRIIVLAEPSQAGYEKARTEIKRLAGRLLGALPELPHDTYAKSEVARSTSADDYCQGVRKIIDYLGEGDGVQMVLSQRFERDFKAHPVTLYRALRSMNPSPYMFLLRMGDYDVVGASPEILVSYQKGMAKVRPIAGTRWRGKTKEEDDALASELLEDEKERAEHVMLVDLGRNDLGRVCKIGSVKVTELMEIERYSHVMHIVSDVTGELNESVSTMDLIRATFPAGTVSGAPKIRAMEVIEELETTRRGLYAGAVGYIAANGDTDLAIAIRTVLLMHGKAYVQAGAGIVYDSVPEREDEECRNKAQAALKALDLAENGLVELT